MQTSTKKEFSNRGLHGILKTLNAQNFDMNILLHGIPYDLAYLNNRHERIEWWVFCQLVANLRPYFTQQEFEEMNGYMVKRGKYFEGILFGFFLFGSNRLARIFHKQIWKLAEFTFNNIKQKTEFLDKNKIRIYAILDEGYEFPAEFAYFTKGAWYELAKFIGRKGFKVEFTVTKQLLTFNVSWDKEGFFFRISRVIRWFFNIKRALFDVIDTHAEMHQRYDQLQESKWILEKQTTQLKTAYEISKSIKQTPNIKDTLTTISKTLLNEADFAAVSIQLNKDIESNQFEFIVQSGKIPEFANSLNRELYVNEKQIGSLTAYTNIQADYQNANELLDYITPIINIAIHNALILNAIIDYRDNLEKKVSERTFELRKARDELVKTNELLKQAQVIQNNFFTNISHEFRTPLTLILGPLQKWKERLSIVLSGVEGRQGAGFDFAQPDVNEMQKDLTITERYALHLLGLINQLLDLSKLEAGKLKLKASKSNIVAFIKGITMSFQSVAERKDITLKVKSEKDEIKLYYDKDKISKIMTNLLSNAFKFTGEGGEVIVALTPVPSPKGRVVTNLIEVANAKAEDQFEGKLEISVMDTGIGISEEELPKLFDRFYQVDSSQTREHEGTGIGLALTKELVELHKGKISVNSKPGEGTEFTIELPTGRTHLKDEEIIEETVILTPLERGKNLTEVVVDETSIVDSSSKTPQNDGVINEDKNIILVVEDNADVRSFIRDSLSAEFQIEEAPNGEEGVRKAEHIIPDLIISDVMMPKMGGNELTKRLKINEKTSHIPIILLTAKSEQQSKLEGLEIGADDYLTKPFDTKELRIRIHNLISIRRKLQEKFGRGDFVPGKRTEEKKLNELDEKFMGKVMEVIENHLSEEEFSSEQLAKELYMSRMQLHRKLKALTGKSSSLFVRSVKLKKAKKMIEENQGNVSEIAYSVGFSSPAYFTKCFKEEFGIPPSDLTS